MTNMTNLYNPNVLGLWGLHWTRVGPATWGCSEGGPPIRIAWLGGQWEAQYGSSEAHDRALGVLPEEALAELLGPGVVAGELHYYPCRPRSSEQQQYTSAECPPLGDLYRGPEGWRFELTPSGWYPTIEAAAQATRLTCWGVTWDPEGEYWEWEGLHLCPIEDKWRASYQDEDPIVRATPEEALEAILGSPIVVLGITYYPHGRGFYRASAPGYLDVLVGDSTGWCHPNLGSEYQTPEELLRDLYELSLAGSQNDLQSAVRDLQELRAIGMKTGLL